MSFVATAVGVVGSVAGAAISGSASRDASRAQQRGTDATIQEQRRQFDATRADFRPWQRSGTQALGRLNALSEGDMSSFYESPGYNFVKQQGLEGLENRFSVRGGGGNAMRALNEYNSGLASQEFGNFWNRQAGLANAGQTATQSVAGFGANAANNIGNAYMNNANQQGSIGLWNAQNQNNMLQGGLSNALYGWQTRKPPTSGGGRGW